MNGNGDVTFGEIPTGLALKMNALGYPHVHGIFHTGSPVANEGRRWQIAVFVDPRKMNPNVDKCCLSFIEESEGVAEGLVLEQVPLSSLKPFGEFLKNVV